MIEVLVAMLVLGSGAMAMVMLQLQALRSSRDGALQSRAMMMAVELAELRAEYRASGHDNEADPYLISFNNEKPDSSKNSCSDAPCSPQDFARTAINDWHSRLAAGFPAARAVVCRDDRAPATVAGDWSCQQHLSAPVYIKLGWHGSANGAIITRPQLTLFMGY